MPQAVQVSMKDFLKTGEFGPIRLGDSLDQVKELIGETPCYTHHRKIKYSSFGYGSIQLFFKSDENPEYQLTLILFSSFPTLEGGPTINLNPWILREKISIADVKTELEEAGIQYSCRLALEIAPDSSVMELRTEGGVILLFFNDEIERPPNTYRLVKISYGQ